MSEEKKEKKEDVEELKEVLNVISQQVPNLIRNIVTSIFSEQAGADMGKAVGAFYKELKDAGIPEETVLKMTENYISTFTSLGDIMKMAVGGKKKEMVVDEEEVSRVINEKLSKEVEEKKE